MKQIIYIDILIGVNLIINYFLLLTTSKFLCLKIKRFRLILGELLSSVYSLYILLPDAPFLTSLIIKLFMAFTIVITVFGFKNIKIFCKTLVCFYFVSFSFSGIMFALWYVFKPKGMAINNGIVYFNISPLMLISSTVIAYFILEFISRIVEKKEIGNLIFDVHINLGSKSVKLKAKVDTCNSLTEPFSNLPVIVVSEHAIKEILPDKFPKSITEYNNNSLNKNLGIKLRFIPFKTVSGEGILPAFKPDFITINGPKKQAYIAICEEHILSSELPALINPILID